MQEYVPQASACAIIFFNWWEGKSEKQLFHKILTFGYKKIHSLKWLKHIVDDI